jgi:hypothetical protein
MSLRARIGDLILMTLKRFSLTLVASCAAAAASPAAFAQEASSPAAAQVSESQLRSFARAVIDLNLINQEMAPRIQAADAEARPALEQQAQQRMESAVRRHNLDPQSFNRISAAVEQNPELVQQVQSLVQEESAGR